MRTETRLKLSMAVSARDFATTHPVADAGFDTALKRLDDSITQADATAMQQVNGVRDEKAARASSPPGRAFPTSGTAWSADSSGSPSWRWRPIPSCAGSLRSPRSNLTTKGFFVAARALVASAGQYQNPLLSAGMTPTFLAEFAQALDNVEGETESSHTGHTDHVAASADLENLARACVRDVDLIGTYYVTTLSKTSDELRAWQSVSKVRRNKPREVTPPEPGARAGAADADRETSRRRAESSRASEIRLVLSAARDLKKPMWPRYFRGPSLRLRDEGPVRSG